MADQCLQNSNETKEPCGSLDSATKKTEDVVMADAAKEKHTLMDELQRTRSHSSSSSDEEVEEGGERRRRKKKKGIKDKIIGDKEEEEEETGLNEECKEEENGETGLAEEKKGFLEKIKEILPGQHKKGEKETTTPSPAYEHSPAQEKKSIIDKIKEKLPGHHKNNENEVEN